MSSPFAQMSLAELRAERRAVRRRLARTYNDLYEYRQNCDWDNAAHANLEYGELLREDRELRDLIRQADLECAQIEKLLEPMGNF